MTRALSYFLLALFSFQLIAPALRPDPGSGLAACCRRDGKHQCAMAHSDGESGALTGSTIRALQPKCPLFPAGGFVPAHSETLFLSVARQTGVPPQFSLANARRDSHSRRNAPRGAENKRGPPYLLNQTNISV
jgi:hypothetical protein